MHGVQPIGGVQERPIVLTVQGRVSVRITIPLQVPAPHTGVEQVRLCEPSGAHVVGALRIHAPRAPHVSAPHVRPAVVRVQASVSVRVSVAHAPPVQSGTWT
jgi:hypothetical protein